MAMGLIPTQATTSSMCFVVQVITFGLVIVTFIDNKLTYFDFIVTFHCLQYITVVIICLVNIL